MKNWKRCFWPLALIAVLLTVGLAACSQPQVDPAEVIERSNKSFEATASVEYKGIVADVRMVRGDGGVYEVEFLSPDAVRGMAFVFGEDKLKVKYMGLTFEIDPEVFPAEPIAKLMMETLNSAFLPEQVEVVDEGEHYVLKGSREGQEFSLGVDIENGELVSMEMPGEELNIIFENFSFLPQAA